jgi:hypothetical protein
MLKYVLLMLMGLFLVGCAGVGVQPEDCGMPDCEGMQDVAYECEH